MIYVLILLLLGLFIGAFLLKRRKWISNLFLMMVAVLFVLLIAEFSYRLFFEPAQPVMKNECGSDCQQRDSLLGFKPAIPGKWKIISTMQGNDTIVNTQYTILRDTLNRGLKYDHRVAYQNTQDVREAVFLGCSFTFGSGIADTATLPYQFGKRANISTVNLGCQAYGLHQVFQVFNDRYGGQDNRNRIFVYSLLSDHFYRAAGVYEWNIDGPYFVAENDSIVNKGLVRMNVSMSYLNAPYYLSFFGSLHLVRDKLYEIWLRKRMKAFSAAEYQRIFALLQQMAVEINKSGGKLVILNWDRSNWGYQGYEFNFQKQLDEDVSRLREIGAVIYTVSSIIDYKDSTNFIRLDGHPTQIANQGIADFLFKDFRPRE